MADHEQVHCPCEHEEGEQSVWRAALLHTLEVLFYVVVFSFAIHLVMEYFGGELLTGWLSRTRLLQPILAALIGLIPNCAASVLLAQLYLSGTITFASLVAGLSSAAGIGLMVLFRSNRGLRRNLLITAALFAVSAAAGLVLSLF